VQVDVQALRWWLDLVFKQAPVVVVWDSDQRLGPLSAQKAARRVLEIQTQQQRGRVLLANLSEAVFLLAALFVLLVKVASRHIGV